MKISREARKISKELFRLACPNGRPDAERARKIAERLAEKKPRHYLQILKEFTRLMRLALSKTHAIVESAVPLDQATAAQVRADLAARFGSETTFSFSVNPALIGGLRIRVGSDVWDGSIRGRLDALRHAA
jgi:F-type H+-transporting ATPase subunit delta